MPIRDIFDKAPPEDRPKIGAAETSAKFDIEVVGVLGGEMCLLTIEAFRDDIGEVDLRFVGTDAVVGKIDAMLESEDGA